MSQSDYLLLNIEYRNEGNEGFGWLKGVESQGWNHIKYEDQTVALHFEERRNRGGLFVVIRRCSTTTNPRSASGAENGSRALSSCGGRGKAYMRVQGEALEWWKSQLMSVWTTPCLQIQSVATGLRCTWNLTTPLASSVEAATVMVPSADGARVPVTILANHTHLMNIHNNIKIHDLE